MGGTPSVPTAVASAPTPCLSRHTSPAARSPRVAGVPPVSKRLTRGLFFRPFWSGRSYLQVRVRGETATRKVIHVTSGRTSRRRAASIGAMLAVAIAMMSLSPASAHFMGADSVDDGEIRFDSRTEHTEPLAHAIAVWNARGQIKIIPDNLFNM